MKILFVCTGNTCRSCMVQVLTQRELEKNGDTLVKVISAGTDTKTGLPASENAVQAMKDMGLDLTAHRSAILDERLIAEADLILALAERHLKEITRIMPEASDRAYTIGSYAGIEGDVADPYGGDLKVYRKTAGELANLAVLAVERLLQSMGKVK
ncbi:MAG: low molecular weight protein arginine phosphatase [Peptococcaceae bacterium]|nr:low molecular weight protein arginine phosphatase [Peptococcaceae bacterium]